MTRNVSLSTLPSLNRRIVKCNRCPGLREYCDEVGRTKRRAYANWDYWAKPVPSFGDENAWLWIVGLAPGAHGANRTGRMFTGDRSGDFLYAGLHRAGLATQVESVSRDDGLKLTGAWITAACHCAPPANKPTREQLINCRPYLIEEWKAMKNMRVILAFGGIAWDAVLNAARELEIEVPRPKPKFGHGAEVRFSKSAATPQAVTLFGCYHVSQQNTFTGRLTETMLDEVLVRAGKTNR